MTLDMIAAGVGVLVLAAAWYGLQFVALRDLRERPSVRGENKLLWAFVVLCLPYAGALGYLVFGPTSFLPRPGRRSAVVRPTAPARSTHSVPIAVARQPSTFGNPITRPEWTSDRPGHPTRPAHSGRPARRLAHDPVIGTDSTDLLTTRLSVARSRRPVPDAIRWPGSAIPHTYQPVDAELHD